MKKVLFGTSALVAAGLYAGSAVAAEPISLSIGGKQEQYFGVVGYSDEAGARDGFGIFTDTELYFTGSTTLDNGITVRAVIQLETQTGQTSGGGNADEQYVDLSGSFGRLRAGEKEGVFDTMVVEAPNAGEVSLADTVTWITTDGTFFNSLDVSVSSDEAQVSYYTPNFMGFQGGVTYIPDVGQALLPGRSGNAATDSENNEFQFGVSYDGEVSGVGIAGSAAGFYRLDTGFGADDMVGWRVGAELSYAGFAVGGAYMNHNRTNASVATDGSVWNVGATYEVGPYGVGIKYGQANSRGGARDGEDDILRSIGVDASYDLGPGISLVGSVFHVATDTDSAVRGGGRSGTGGVAGIALSF